MECGFSKKITTPKVGMPMAGSYEIRYAKGVLDDLHVRALAFSDGETKAAVISVEICHMDTVIYDECRTRIANENGVDRDSVIITLTHTHSGPETNAAAKHYLEDNPDNKKIMQEYVEFLKDRICDAAREAFLDLKPAKLYSAEGHAEDVNFVRSYRMADGTVQTNPGLDWNAYPDPSTCCPIPDNTGVVHPVGKPNDTVRLLKIEREGGRDVYVVNFSCHATSVHTRKICSDYPGLICSTLEGAFGGEIDCMFLLAPAGDVCQINRNPSEEEKRFLVEDNENNSETRNKAKHIARVVSGEVLKMCMLAKEVKSDKVSFGMKELALPANKDDANYEEALKVVELHKAGRHHELPYEGMALVTYLANANRIVRMKTAPDFFYHKIFAISVGDFALAGLPGEPFTEIGDRILDASEYKATMLCTLTNAQTTYFATTYALGEGGYEAAASNLGPGTDDVIVDEMSSLLKEIKN